MAFWLRARIWGRLASPLGAQRCRSSTQPQLDWEDLLDKGEEVSQALRRTGATVGIAETSSGGLISAAVLSSSVGNQVFRGSGIRLPRGISEDAGRDAKSATEKQLLAWGIEYASKEDVSQTGTVNHALELAHAAKFNLGTDWGIGESGVAGPDAHPRTGFPAGMGFVAVVGPTESKSGVLKVDAVGATGRRENMRRFAVAALSLMSHIIKSE